MATRGAERRYDFETGQVYSETIVHRWRQPVSWEHKHASNAKIMHKSPPYHSPFGASSLTDIVLRQLVRDASSLTPNILRQTPRHFVEMIWKAVRREYVLHYKELLCRC